MDNAQDDGAAIDVIATRPRPRWGWGRIVGYTAAVIGVYLAAQIGALIAVAVVQAILIPGFDVRQWTERADRDGIVMSAATFAGAMLCIPLVRILVGQHEPAPWTFLGLRPVRGRDVVRGCAAMLILIAVSDSINVWLLDRPLVPPFMTDAYATAGKPILLFAAIALVAPVLEELFFRGFLFGALRARGVSLTWVIAITTLLFTVAHTQYDVHDLAAVLLIGLLLGLARARFDSIVPSIVMHALTNAVAFAETALIMRT